ncbi:MAG: hypothetical protein RIQ46_325 [Pseudomonadota bacterium]|jgi:hypothetical protein
MAEAAAQAGAVVPAAGGRSRWPLALAAGAIAAFATFTISLGDVLTAHGRPEQALALPFNRTMPAWRVLAADRGRPETPAMRQLAESSLAASPVAAVPLTWLALAEQARGRGDRGQRLLALSATTGWHDVVAQRQLYNLAVSRGDFTTALRHADALLRQGHGREELFARFDLGMARPGFRKAMADMVATSPGWPRDYIVGHGARLDDVALASLLDARTRGGGTLAREIAVPLISGLLVAGRDAAAAGVWRRVGGADGMAAGTLAWRDGAMVFPAGVFDWQLPEGFRIEGVDNGTLVAGFDAVAEPARRMLALPPGDWRLVPDQPDAVTGSWQWTIACRSGAAGPWLPLAAGQAATVRPGCPVQVLALRRTIGVEDSTLPELRLERLR